jgi:murein DD-endopeptidase MepM/ murein hydrolase activator NlpD
MRGFFLLLLVTIYFPLLLKAQSLPNYPQHYFQWPVGAKIGIVANLGELRHNHWHMGLDVRTDQVQNKPVYAAADGYIARIRIEPFGYGRSIFINHPNGLTTVYGHLNNYFPALEKYVTDQQYKQETWAIELTFLPDQFPVKKGQFIAYSGTTGGSQGPHTHFEIRDTKSDKCLNPLLFGFPLADNVPPNLVKLAIYDRNKSIYEQDPSLYPVKKSANGSYQLNSPIVKTGNKKLSFAIQAYDRMSATNNPDGIYSAQLFFDDKPVIEFVLDSIDYNETKYVNAHIDYRYRENGGAFLQHLSRMPGDHGPVYKPVDADGIIELNDNNVHSVHIEIKDAYQNITSLNFQLQFMQSLEKDDRNEGIAKSFVPNYVNVLDENDFEVYMDENCLYDTVQPVYYRSNSDLPMSVSALHEFGDASIPVHGEYTVRIKPSVPVPAEWRDKLIIKRTGRGNSVRKAKWERDWVTGRFGDFGNFQVFADTEPPILNELGRGDTIDLSAARRIIFQPKDNSGVISSFRAELDGDWLRFTNDKALSWIYEFDDKCGYGVHELKVSVKDITGNETVKSWWFKRYPYKPPAKKATVKKPIKKTIVKKKH